MAASPQSPAVSNTMQALFANLIDYAGVFPPASLDLSTAVNCYTSYRTKSYAWILGRLLLTASQLAELPLLTPSQSGVKPAPLSVISRNLSSDLPNLQQNLTLLRDRAVLTGIEITLDPKAAITDQVSQVASLVDSLDLRDGGPSIFFELPFTDAWEGLLVDLLRVLSGTTSRTVGFKLRCGGDPQVTPTPYRVALALHETSAHQIPIKFTAGLHHPFRHESEVAGAKSMSHGYFNVFFAALLAHAREVSLSHLESIVSESSSKPIVTNDEITWMGSSLSAVEIARLRATRVISFGSCSFDEPISDAVHQGWLP